MPYLSNPDFLELEAAVMTAMDALTPSNNSEEVAAHSSLSKAFDLITEAKNKIADETLRDRADELYGSEDIEIDDEGVGTAPSDDGVWVQAWVFVRDEEEEDEEIEREIPEDTPCLDTSFHDHEMEID